MTDDDYALLEMGFHGIDENDAKLGVDWLYTNLIPRGSSSLGILMGESGIGKSTVAVDLAVATMTATPFAGHMYDNREEGEYITPHGHPTGILKPSSVVFIHGEGEASLNARFVAAFEARKRAFPHVDAFSYEARNLPILKKKLVCTGEGDQSLQSNVETFIRNRIPQRTSNKTGLATGLIIVDTFMAVAGITNENDNGSMQSHINSFKRLSEKFNATVLLIAHTKKGTNDMRGASAPYNGADFILRITKKTQNPDTLSLVNDKARHTQLQPPKHFRLSPPAGATIPPGEGVESLVVDWVDSEKNTHSKAEAHTEHSKTPVVESAPQWSQAVEAERTDERTGFDVYIEAVELAIIGHGVTAFGFSYADLTHVRARFDGMYQRSAEANRKAFARAHNRAINEDRVLVRTVDNGRQQVRFLD